MAKKGGETNSSAAPKPADPKRPEAVFRIGSVSASVFAREFESEGEKRVVRSVSVQRRYQEGTETKYTTSFNLAELLQAVRVLQLAQHYIEQREATLQPAGE